MVTAYYGKLNFISNFYIPEKDGAHCGRIFDYFVVPTV